MVKIHLYAYAVLREILGSNELEVSTQAKTVGEVIEVLAERYSPTFKETLIDSDSKALKRSYRIFVNGRDIEFLDMLKTRIGEGDKLVFFPPFAGG